MDYEPIVFETKQESDVRDMLELVRCLDGEYIIKQVALTVVVQI